MREKFAVQLYTLREELDKDLPKVLKDLKQMGWAGVQLGDFHGYQPEEIASLLNELGLSVAGMMVDIERLRTDLSEVLKEAALFHTKDLIFPYVPEGQRDKNNYIALRKILNEAASEMKSRGYRVSYHNHDFELNTRIDSQSALEYMLAPVKENLILAQIDIYWLKKAGYDPLRFIQPYTQRMPMIHLKDMNEKDETFAALGTGIIDVAPIISWGEANGIEWYVVEQDECPGNPMDSLQISFDYLNQLVEKESI